MNPLQSDDAYSPTDITSNLSIAASTNPLTSLDDPSSIETLGPDLTKPDDLSPSAIVDLSDPDKSTPPDEDPYSTPPNEDYSPIDGQSISLLKADEDEHSSVGSLLLNLIPTADLQQDPHPSSSADKPMDAIPQDSDFVPSDDLVTHLGPVAHSDDEPSKLSIDCNDDNIAATVENSPLVSDKEYFPKRLGAIRFLKKVDEKPTGQAYTIFVDASTLMFNMRMNSKGGTVVNYNWLEAQEIAAILVPKIALADPRGATLTFFSGSNSSNSRHHVTTSEVAVSLFSDKKNQFNGRKGRQLMNKE